MMNPARKVEDTKYHQKAFHVQQDITLRVGEKSGPLQVISDDEESSSDVQRRNDRVRLQENPDDVVIPSKKQDGDDRAPPQKVWNDKRLSSENQEGDERAMLQKISVVKEIVLKNRNAMI